MIIFLNSIHFLKVFVVVEFYTKNVVCVYVEDRPLVFWYFMSHFTNRFIIFGPMGFFWILIYYHPPNGLRTVLYIWQVTISVSLHFWMDPSPYTAQSGQLIDSVYNVSDPGCLKCEWPRLFILWVAPAVYNVSGPAVYNVRDTGCLQCERPWLFIMWVDPDVDNVSVPGFL